MERNESMTRLPLAPVNSHRTVHEFNPKRSLKGLVGPNIDANALPKVANQASVSRSVPTSRIPTPGQTPRSSEAKPPSSSRIPCPPGRSAAAPAAVADKTEEQTNLDGFQAYFNPSFDMVQPNNGCDAAAVGASQSHRDDDNEGQDMMQTPLGNDMLTPEALQILRHINQKTPCAEDQGVRNIMNAFLRTGPANLSPEPSYEYLIQVPPPAAVMAPGIMNFAGAGGEGVYGAINGYLRTGANLLSPEPGGQQEVGVPVPGQAVVHDAGHGKLHKAPLPAASPAFPSPPPSAIPAPPAPAAAGHTIDPPSVCSNVVGGRWKQAQQTDSDEEPAPQAQEAMKDAKQATQPMPPAAHSPAELPAPILLAPVNSGMAGQQPASIHQPHAKLSSERKGVRSSRLPSPVAFNLSPGDDSPSLAMPQADHKDGPSTSGSFSFGMRPASIDDHTCDPCFNRDGDEENLPRVDSGETVHQPNPFAKMLQHLHGADAPTASPMHPSIKASQTQQDNGSPQSPQECTPLHLLPDNVSPTMEATPELGRGDFQQWISHRSLNGILASPALRDLGRLWKAAADRSGAMDEVDVLKCENGALRQELEEVYRMLRALGEEHNAAVAEAQTEKQFAEAEASRAQEAAQQMQALAEQIQATFAACERDNQVLAAELDASVARLIQAEVQAESDMQIQVAEARFAAKQAQLEACTAKEEAAKAAAELDSIRAQLAAAQSGRCATPLSKLKERLQEVHHNLGALYQSSPQRYTPEISKLLKDSKAQLGEVSHLLHPGLEEQREQNTELKAELLKAVETLARLSPERSYAPRDDIIHKSSVEAATPVAAPEEGQCTVTVDFKDFQQAMGLDSDIAVAVGEAASPNDVPVIDAPIDLNTPAGCSIVVEGMVVTNVPASQLSKVKNMVRFFETLGEGPQEGSAPAQHEEVEVPASACAQRESDTTSTTATTGDDVDDVPNTPNIPPAGTQSPEVLFNGVDTYVDMPQENNDPETPPTQVVVNGNGARAHAIASHPIAITPSSLQTTTSGQAASPVASVGVVTPLSVGALYGKTGEEIRQEVRARLQRLKSDLQAAQSKLKNVDRDLAAFSTPRPSSGPRAVVSSGAGSVSGPAHMPSLTEEQPVAEETTMAASQIAVGSAPTPATNIVNDTERTIERERSGVLRTEGTTASKRRLSVRFAPSVKGSDDSDNEGQAQGGRKARHPVTPGITSKVTILPAVHPSPVVGSTRTVQPQLTRIVQRALADAESVQKPKIQLNWQDATEAGENTVKEKNVPSKFSARAMDFESDSDDDENAGGRVNLQAESSSRIAMLADFSMARTMSTPIGGGVRTPHARPSSAGRTRSTPLLRGTPSQSLLSTTSSFSPPEPLALLAIRPLVGRVRRGAAGGSSSRRPSESEEKEFRRRAAALRIHVSPYFNRREGGKTRDGDVL